MSCVNGQIYLTFTHTHRIECHKLDHKCEKICKTWAMNVAGRVIGELNYAPKNLKHPAHIHSTPLLRQSWSVEQQVLKFWLHFEIGREWQSATDSASTRVPVYVNCRVTCRRANLDKGTGGIFLCHMWQQQLPSLHCLIKKTLAHEIKPNCVKGLPGNNTN